MGSLSRISLGVVGLVALCTGVLGLSCVTRDQCSCVYDDNSGVVDLSGIGNQDGTAMFADIIVENYWYSYNPCYPFSDGNCVDTAACQYDAQYNAFYDIGSADKASFTFDGRSPILTYESEDGYRTTYVTLLCDPQATIPSLDVQGEMGYNQYYMTLTTAAACPVPVSDDGSSNSSLSAGSVLLIVLFALLAVYMVVGVAYMKLRNQASGRELLPNVAFWASVPGLIKDGVNFSKSLVVRRQGYESA